MAQSPFQHASGVTTIFGVGAAPKAVGNALKRAARVMVITDGGVRAAGLVEPLLTALGTKVVLIDDAVVPDADADHVDAIAGAARDHGVDSLVAVGGGSVIDTAKMLAAVLARAAFVDAQTPNSGVRSLEGIGTIRAKCLPLVAVPTTAGTGAEATQFAVLKDRPAGKKRISVDPSLVPSHAVLDPALTVGLPRAIGAATGVDALTHAFEAVASTLRNPIATALATDSIRRILVEGALARVLVEPADVNARGEMLIAAHQAGLAISSAMLGATHAFAHALGALKSVPHGVANGIFLVRVLELNAAAAAPAYGRLATALGFVDAQALFRATETLVHDVAQVPRTMAAYGVTAADVDALVALAAADPDLTTNPTPLPANALEAVFRHALG